MPASPSQQNNSSPVILLVTAAEIEARMLEHALKERHSRELQPDRSKGVGYNTLGSIGGAAVYHIQSRKGSGGPGGALETVAEGIDKLEATAVIYVGIAGGIKDGPAARAIGDILISDQIYAYEPATITPHGRERRGNTVPCPVDMYRRATQAQQHWSHPPSVHLGLILSGEKLADDQDILNAMLKEEPRAIGIEMEGAGLYVAADRRKCDWLLIKGISDWANGTKRDDDASEGSHDERRSRAALNAARFVLHLIELGGWGGTETMASQGDLSDGEQAKLADLLRRINDASTSNGRRAICLRIGYDPSDVSFIESSSPRTFADLLIRSLIEQRQHGALRKLCDVLLGALGEGFRPDVQAIRAKL